MKNRLFRHFLPRFVKNRLTQPNKMCFTQKFELIFIFAACPIPQKIARTQKKYIFPSKPTYIWLLLKFKTLSQTVCKRRHKQPTINTNIPRNNFITLESLPPIQPPKLVSIKIIASKNYTSMFSDFLFTATLYNTRKRMCIQICVYMRTRIYARARARTIYIAKAYSNKTILIQ